MLKHRCLTFSLCFTVAVTLSSCATSSHSGTSAKYMIPYVGPILAIQDSISNEEKMKLSQKIMTDPDLPAWYEAREKITMAVGDRIIDSDVASVYPAVITGVSTLQVNIENVEKESGFINGSGKILPPDRAESFRKERMVEYAKANGMNPKAADPGPFFDPATMSAVMEQATGMTITVGPHGDGKTKVKVRFTKIYYPAELQECYAVLWQAVDKQGFLNDSLDSPAENVKPQ